MDVHVRLSWKPASERPTNAPLLQTDRRLKATHPATKTTTLATLFRSLERHHPELAPLLENAAHQSDLEIFVNDQPVPPRESTDEIKLQDGDTVSLFVRVP